ncbi:MAG: DUF523 domain-containing protein [Sneathiella sp.]
MDRILISSCLLGQKVRYNGTSKLDHHSVLQVWQQEGRLVPLCPELAAGFQVPRPAAEIAQGKSGDDVLLGKAKIIEETGRDVTELYQEAARQALILAQRENCQYAILTDGSPSCGVRFIYDGNFAGNRHSGRGITTALLEKNGIRVLSEAEIEILRQTLSEE